MIPRSSTAALPPQPFPFFSWATGGFAPALGLVGAGFAAAGFAVAGFGAGGGFGGAGAGTAGAGAVGLGGGGDMVKTSIMRVPPPFATPAASSVGSNTIETSPNRMLAPGASGVSPLTGSPSTNGPFVDSRSTNTHTPSRRCSFAWVVETDSSGNTRSL